MYKKKFSASGKVFWFCGVNRKFFINYVFFNEKNLLVLKQQKKGKKREKSPSNFCGNPPKKSCAKKKFCGKSGSYF